MRINLKELFHNITEDGESIDGNVDKMNVLLTDIFEKYTKVELDRTIQCDYCIGRKGHPTQALNGTNHDLQKSVIYYTIAINVHYQFLMVFILTKIE